MIACLRPREGCLSLRWCKSRRRRLWFATSIPSSPQNLQWLRRRYRLRKITCRTWGFQRLRLCRQRHLPTESVLAAALGPVLTAAQVLDTVQALVSEAVAASAEECTRSEVEFHRRKNFQRPILSTPRKPAERRLRAPALYG